MALGLTIDALVGDPDKWHPVAGFGRLMMAAEERMYRDSRAAGAAYAAVGLGLGVLAGTACPSVSAMTAVVAAGKGLASAAAAVGAALDGGRLDEARRLLPALVGREPTQLDSRQIARAVVESVAE
ncbi:MAG TPA: cobalamin biosynthesis protein, partial [Acidimicrobiales bacterium]